MTPALVSRASERRTSLALLFLAWACVLALPCRAAVKTWDGSSSGNWSTSANWTNNAAPVNGDDLVFPSATTRFNVTNNLSNLRLRSITFSATSNYFLYGNTITLTNGVLAAQPAGYTNTIFLNLTNPVTQVVNVSNSGAALVMNGVLAGPGGLTKTGDGLLLFGGASNNLYAGVTTVSNGTLELNDSSLATRMVPGDLVIHAGATVLLTEANQIADTASVTIHGDGTGPSGLLNLNNYNETITTLTLTNGGDVATGFGTLTLSNNFTASASFGAALDAATLSGNLAIGTNTRTITVLLNTNGGPECVVSANILGSGTAGLIKAGGGTLRLGGANTYPGLTTISNGFVYAASPLAFGSGASGTILRAGGLRLEGVTITNEWFTNNAGAALLEATDAVSGWSSNIVLNTSLTVNVFTNGLLDLGGAISGAGGVTKNQPGTLRYSGGAGNSYTGNTTVNEGTLEFAKSSVALANVAAGTLTIGDGVGGATADKVRYVGAGGQLLIGVSIVIRDSGWLNLNGVTDTVGPINLEGGRIDTGNGTLGLFNTLTARSSSNFPATIFGHLDLASPGRTFSIAAGDFIPDLYVGAEVSNGGITKTGGGSLALASSNSFLNTLILTDGRVQLQNDYAAGATGGGVSVNGNSQLVLEGGISVGAESLTLNNPTPGATALSSSAGETNSWAGNIVLPANTRVAVQDDGLLELAGVISGPGELIKESGGALLLSGAGANTYTNVTTVEEGTLLLAKSVAAGAIAGPLVVGDGLGGIDGDVVRYENSAVPQLATNVPVFVAVSGLLNFNGADDSVGALSGEGNVLVPSGSNPGFGADGSSSTFDGVFTGTGGFRKLGAGTLTLNGDNTNSATVRIAAGTLLVNGSQPFSSITLSNNATLGGEGEVGNIINTAGGNVAPGNSPGLLTCADITFSGAASDFLVELNGPLAGFNYDQLNAQGSVSLGGSTLKVSVGAGFAPVEGQPLVILNKSGSDSISGTFAGQAAGSILSVGALKFQIRYNGGTGNDITLTLTNAPLKATNVAVLGGNGNGLIESNECNHLNVALTNTSGFAISNITASLTTTAAHVIITPPLSAWADLAANGRGTNATPFQISTLPSFVCGAPLALVLTVNCSTGTFATTFSAPTGCGAGSGFCATCPGALTNAITTNDLTGIVRLNRIFDKGGTCAAPTECPGPFVEASPVHYDAHSFTNTGATACYTVHLANPCGNLFAAAYLGAFNRSNVCANYLADLGDNGGFRSFSFSVPAGSNFTVVVHEMPSQGAGCNYLLVVSSSDCSPRLDLATVATNRVRLSWPTSAAGYLLDAATILGPTNWSVVTNQPIAASARFSVTNVPGTNRFYRLRRP